MRQQTSESGHARNVTNLELLINSFASFGDIYNPAKKSITLEALQSVMSSGKESLSACYNAESIYRKAVDNRELAYESIAKLISRVNNALKASDSSSKNDENIQSIIRKLRGKRAHAMLSDEELTALKNEGKEITYKSVSQMSYDSRLENFERLISYLSKIPEYNPNEEELKLDSLRALCSQLKTRNSEVLVAHIQLENARAQRNKILYQPLTGIVDLALDAKTYIKSIFGASGSEYKLIAKIYFKKIM